MSGAEDGPRASDAESRTHLLREYLVTLAFRFRHATADAPEGFGAFDPGAGVRTPSAIVLHMTGLLEWARDQYRPGDARRLEPLAFEDECARFLTAVGALDRVFAEGRAPVSELDFDRMWRGPLVDAMTHVGQLAMLRRLAGDPVARVRYWQVDMPPVR